MRKQIGNTKFVGNPLEFKAAFVRKGFVSMVKCPLDYSMMVKPAMMVKPQPDALRCSSMMVQPVTRRDSLFFDGGPTRNRTLFVVFLA